jgi:hypothetical protein
MSIDAVRRKHETRLMKLPNVTGIGTGRRSGRDVIKVFVTRKVSESALQPDEIVPKSLDGVETDVEEVGEITAQSH